MSDWATRRAIIAAIGIVLVSFWMSFKEMGYVVSGRTVEARLVSAREERVQKTQNSMPYPQLRVDYEFEDGDKTRAETDAVTPEWPIDPKAQTVTVEYIPGSDRSRLKGNHHHGWLWTSGVIILLGCLIGGVWWKYRDAT